MTDPINLTSGDLTKLTQHIETEEVDATIDLTGAKDFWDMTDEEHDQAQKELGL